MEESTRIKQFKDGLIKELTFYPNDKTTSQKLESESLHKVLTYYLHWRSRIVPPRCRTAVIEPEVKADSRYKALEDKIEALLDKVRNGEDINLYHSKRAHQYGYTPEINPPDYRDDKDTILNTAGFHHFHLDALPNRTDDVLFAYVTRGKFQAIGIFNHEVFNSDRTSCELVRMWALHEKHARQGMGRGNSYVRHRNVVSKYPAYLIEDVDEYMKIIGEYDSKLDERNYINSLYNKCNLQPPSRFKFEWCMNALDLCVRDRKNNETFNLYEADM
ncbi:hypothetical protein AKG98_1637 [Moritella sp. JT01]|uniref:hypothetical protein n=1 Tax=Moritella sp. JT01 TaxID=756698 RepID=UPI00079B924E|nr:hypothetical protein [Moritella sp. JT01]KXO13892.1 hypothetical protein AKG98_1637 [Moritella sp. JT01]